MEEPLLKEDCCVEIPKEDTQTHECHVDENIFDDELNTQNREEVMMKIDQSTNVNFVEIANDYSHNIFMCNRYVTPTSCEAETLVCTPIVKEKVRIVYLKEKETKSEKEEEAEEKENICTTGFHGLTSINHEQALIDLAGVTIKAFQLLHKILSKDELDRRMKISNENKLLMFLVKMRLGLTFSALGVLFHVHRSTASRLFYSTLQYLAAACKNFVYWPEKYVVQETMPSVFKPDYSQCRVIIDSTEFVVQQPATVEQRVQFYSHYKKGYRIKIVIGCLPSGLICLVSKSHGGRATDAQITISSGLLDLLEPGDVVLADKGFPQIKT